MSCNLLAPGGYGMPFESEVMEKRASRVNALWRMLVKAKPSASMRSGLDRWVGRGGFKQQGLLSGMMTGRPLPSQRLVHYDRPLRRAFRVHAPLQPGQTRSTLQSAFDWAKAPFSISSDLARLPFGRHGWTGLKVGLPVWAGVKGYQGLQEELDWLLQQAGLPEGIVKRILPGLTVDAAKNLLYQAPGMLWDRVTGATNPTDKAFQQQVYRRILDSMKGMEAPVHNALSPIAHGFAGAIRGLSGKLLEGTAPVETGGAIRQVMESSPGGYLGSRIGRVAGGTIRDVMRRPEVAEAGKDVAKVLAYRGADSLLRRAVKSLSTRSVEQKGDEGDPGLLSRASGYLAGRGADAAYSKVVGE